MLRVGPRATPTTEPYHIHRMTLLWAIIVGGLLVGPILLIAGVRGRRVDDHPLCGRCRYDLVGSPGVARCPECGGDLTLPKSRRWGNRRKRRVLMVLGLTILIPALSGGGLLAYHTARDTDWTKYKPLWLLRSDLQSGQPSSRQAAEQEILRRLNADKFSRRAVSDMVDDFLDIQADETATWRKFYGDFIETAWLKEKLAHDDLVRYLETAANDALSLAMRPRVRQNSSVMYALRISPTRASSLGTFTLHLRRGVVRLSDGRVFEEKQRFSKRTLAATGWSSHGSWIQFNVPQGKYTLEVEAEYVIPEPLTEVSLSTVAEWDLALQTEEYIISWPHNFSIPIEVVPEDHPVVDLIDDDSLAEEIRRAITTPRVVIWQRREGTVAHVLVHARDLPVEVAFDVLLRTGDREWLASHVVSRRGSLRRAITRGIPPLIGFPDDITTVDLVLRTNPLLVDDMPGTSAIWKGEIVFKDVVLQHPVQPDR